MKAAAVWPTASHTNQTWEPEQRSEGRHQALCKPRSFRTHRRTSGTVDLRGRFKGLECSCEGAESKLSPFPGLRGLSFGCNV
jgi:hypothetical protein